jgi:Tfp pilus assembly protein PilN
LPAPIQKVERTQAWTRIELWRNTTICLSGHGPARGRVQVFNAGSAQSRVQAGVATWISGADPKHLEVLKADAGTAIGQGRTLSTADEQHLGEWLSAWMGVLSADAVQAPVIAPIPYATPRHVYIMAGIAAELVIAALCVAHWMYVDKAKKTVLEQLGQRQRIVQQAADLQKNTDKAKTELKELAETDGKIEHARTQLEQDFGQQRRRIELLLSGLATRLPEDVAIQSISTGDANMLMVKGIALDSSQPDQLALNLSDALQSTGWTVEPIEKIAEKRLSSGGPWKFTLAMRDPSAAAPATKVPEPLTANRGR